MLCSKILHIWETYENTANYPLEGHVIIICFHQKSYSPKGSAVQKWIRLAVQLEVMCPAQYHLDTSTSPLCSGVKEVKQMELIRFQ